jgi:hypothetical protein
MHIIERTSNEMKQVHVRLVDDSDFKTITVRRHSFNWKKIKNESLIYKLTLINSKDILGLIAIVDYPEEQRSEIKLLAVSAENLGKEKKFEGIAGCLIAFACKEALLKFKDFPCVSLIPKTELKQHYINKYHMIDAGWQLYLEDIPLFNIIKEYSP